MSDEPVSGDSGVAPRVRWARRLTGVLRDTAARARQWARRALDWPRPLEVGPTLALLTRLTGMLLIYSLCRIAFFLFNRELFPNTTLSNLPYIMYGGVRFDLAGWCWTNLLTVLLYLLPLKLRHHRVYQRLCAGVFLAINGLGLLVTCADFVLFRFTLARATASVFEEFGHETDLGSKSVGYVFEFWGVTLFWLVTLALMVWLHERVRVSRTPPLRRALLYYPLGVLLFLVGGFFTAVGARGGFFVLSHRPITNSNAGAYVEHAEEVSLVVNTPLSFIRTFDKEPLHRLHYLEDEARAHLYTPVRHGRGITRHDNVVLLILESYGREHVGLLNPDLEDGKYQGFTPFLDSLLQRSRYYPNAFANGMKSIDALPSLVGGIPALVEPYVLSHQYADRLSTLASHLAERGYSTAFFHGAPNGSMGFDAFVKLAGFARYYGMSEYGNDKDYDGSWGIWDEPYFQYFAASLSKMQEPFFATLFSVSSHSPYNVPAEYVGKLRVGPMRVERCIHYTDQALEKFFATAAKQPWYDHTLFILSADHGAAPHRPIYKTPVGRFRIPMLLFHPGDDRLHGVDPLPAQQLDVLPTVLNYLGIDGDYLAFGNDLLDDQAQRFVINWRNGLYQFFEGEYVLHFDGTHSVALYRYNDDKLLQHNLLQDAPEVRERMEPLAQAVIQEITNRLLDDRLTMSAARR